MDTTEKILLAFIFRLLLLVLAVFAARHLPDHGLRTASTGQVEVALAGRVECALGTASSDRPSELMSDMLLHD